MANAVAALFELHVLARACAPAPAGWAAARQLPMATMSTWLSAGAAGQGRDSILHASRQWGFGCHLYCGPYRGEPIDAESAHFIRTIRLH